MRLSVTPWDSLSLRETSLHYIRQKSYLDPTPGQRF